MSHPTSLHEGVPVGRLGRVVEKRYGGPAQSVLTGMPLLQGGKGRAAVGTH